jgi:hypothetical protein
MPLLVLFLVVISTSYQFFFRFDHWTNPENPAIVYERDNLTGQVHQFKPGQSVPLISRITGHYDAAHHTSAQKESNRNEPLVASAPSPNPARRLQQANSAPPVPEHHSGLQSQPTAVAMPAIALPSTIQSTQQSALQAASVNLAKTPQMVSPTPSTQPKGSYAENRVDLNQDGNDEKITLQQTHPDGLVDITILNGQREVFYGRGQRLQMLANRQHGWSDIALIGQQGQSLIFTYQPQQQEYVLATSGQNPPEPE